MTEQEELQRFMAKPDIEQVRGQYPDIRELLIGDFGETPNVYRLDQGTVVSWNLIQGEQRKPEYAKGHGKAIFRVSY